MSFFSWFDNNDNNSEQSHYGESDAYHHDGGFDNHHDSIAEHHAELVHHHDDINHHDSLGLDGHHGEDAYIDNNGVTHSLSGFEGEFSPDNADTILHYADPLMHSHTYQCQHLSFDGHDFADPLVHVNGYVKTDGTVVDSHVRTMPDGIEENNFSFHHK